MRAPIIAREFRHLGLIVAAVVTAQEF
ncbi:hypothetical protein PT2222_170083 [Paraburkholderia tropica]